MTSFAFDTLSASKRLREAGMAEGVAEAVVAVFQHATVSLDFGQLATKDDLATLRGEMAAKADIADMATKADLEFFHAATKHDLALQAAAARSELGQLELRLQRRSDQQMWGVIGLLSGVIVLATTVIKLFP